MVRKKWSTVQKQPIRFQLWRRKSANWFLWATCPLFHCINYETSFPCLFIQLVSLPRFLWWSLAMLGLISKAIVTEQHPDIWKIVSSVTYSTFSLNRLYHHQVPDTNKIPLWRKTPFALSSARSLLNIEHKCVWILPFCHIYLKKVSYLQSIKSLVLSMQWSEGCWDSTASAISSFKALQLLSIILKSLMRWRNVIPLGTLCSTYINIAVISPSFDALLCFQNTMKSTIRTRAKQSNKVPGWERVTKVAPRQLHSPV